jgi:L-alanine-DL-glutamate epimerase-like enolase superfamily enzyme
MLELRSADILMPDLQRVGGVSEFIRVGHMAESYDIPVSSHLFPETSLQVLGALANTIYLEYTGFPKSIMRRSNSPRGRLSFPNGRDGGSHSIKTTSRI